ncbi:MAG: GNAT family N-acetyltransferase [Armatimonadota bacterium]
MGYTLTNFTQVTDTPAQVMRLSNAAFVEYEGAMEVDVPWTEWYLQRPGTDLVLCQAALDGNRLVSQVLVCIQELQLGGQRVRCGLIDSVATYPEHRRKGLARALMNRAHDALQCAGAAAAVLYTNPAGHPYGFYGRLGYITRAQGAMFMGPRPSGDGCAPVPVDAAAQASGLCALLNRYYAGYEGYAPMDGGIWRWHKLDPPGTRPVVVAEMTGSGPVSTATFARAELRLPSGTQVVSTAYDLAADTMTADQIRSLLAAAPEETVLVVLDEKAPECQMMAELGLQREVGEVAMVLPFAQHVREALADHHGPWYFMVESLVGV